MRFSFEKVFFKGTPFFFVTRICEGLTTFTGIFLGGGKCAINAHIPRVNRPSRGATSLRTRALQFANVTRQSMRGHRAASDAQPSESMRTFLASINPPGAQPRCARARSNSRMSRDNQCARIALHPMLNHPNQCAHPSRQSTLQGRNRVAHARAPIRECHATINARVSRCIRHNHPNQCAHFSRQSTLQGRNLVAHARAPRCE